MRALSELSGTVGWASLCFALYVNAIDFAGAAAYLGQNRRADREMLEASAREAAKQLGPPAELIYYIGRPGREIAYVLFGRSPGEEAKIFQHPL